VTPLFIVESFYVRDSGESEYRIAKRLGNIPSIQEINNLCFYIRLNDSVNKLLHPRDAAVLARYTFVSGKDEQVALPQTPLSLLEL
jgi:hypothetical protein